VYLGGLKLPHVRLRTYVRRRTGAVADYYARLINVRIKTEQP